MARFDKLPSEILFEIANFLKPLPHQDADDRYHRQLAYLGRVNRRFHDLFTKTLYQEGAFRATRWAVDSGRLEVLELSLRIAPEETLESINEDHSLKARGSILLRGKSFVSFVNVRTSNEEYEWRAQDIHLGPDGEDFCHEARLLHLAAAHGHNDIVNFLLDNGAEIDAPSHGLCSCLDIHHRVHQIRLRLPWLEGWPAAWHPLHHSMCSGHPSTALLLLERSASLRITSEDDPGPPVFALDSAIAHGHFQIVRRILQRYRQDPTSPDFEYPEDEYTPAHSLALCFDYHAAFDIASQLRDAGFDLNAIRLSSAERLDPNRVANINNIGASPLGLACYFGNFEAAMALLRAGASPITALEEGVICLTVILSAAFPKWAHSGLTVEAWENYRITLMDAMVSAGAPVNPPPGSNYHSPLALATKNGLHNEIKLLLECASIDVDYIQNHRDTTRTALMYAAHHADPRAMLWLLHARANINLCDSDGRSVAYHLFFHQKSLSRFERYHSTTMECLRLLLSRGADFGMLHFDQDRRDEESKSFGETTLGLLMCEISSPRQLPDSGRHGRRVRGQAWKFEYVDTILDKATRHNVSEETWRHAVASLFAPIGSPFRPFENGPGTRLCQKIKNLGERLGYVLDDDEWFLRSICEGINANGISDLDMLRWFSVSDDAALLIPTTNGYLTWETILVAILLDDRPNPEVVGELLKLSNRRLVINGRIPVLHGASLFSLACMPSKPDSLSIIKELLAFSNEWDINAPTCNGLTPLMLLCLRKDESPAVYQLALAGRTRRNDPAVARKIRDTDAAETLLRRGAKAYLKFKGPIAPPPPGSVVDLLEPADGRRRARRGVDAIARSVRHHLEFDSPDGKQHSAYELAFFSQRRDLVYELRVSSFPDTRDEMNDVLISSRALAPYIAKPPYTMLEALLQATPMLPGIAYNGDAPHIMKMMLDGLEQFDLQTVDADAGLEDAAKRIWYFNIWSAFAIIGDFARDSWDVNLIDPAVNRSIYSLLDEVLKGPDTLTKLMCQKMFSLVPEEGNPGRGAVNCSMANKDFWTAMEHSDPGMTVVHIAGWVLDCMELVPFPLRIGREIWTRRPEDLLPEGVTTDRILFYKGIFEDTGLIWSTVPGEAWVCPPQYEGGYRRAGEDVEGQPY